MIVKYLKTLIYKTKKYDKKAKNPFLEFCKSENKFKSSEFKNDFINEAQNSEYNPFKSIYEQTYIWVENQK